MQKPNVDNLTPEQARYIDFLEGQCQGASNLIKELNLISDGYAKDLAMIRLGQAGDEGQHLNYIKSDKNNAIFGRVMTLVDKIDKFIQIDNATKPTEAKTVEQEEKSVTTTITKKKSNIQDFVLQA